MSRKKARNQVYVAKIGYFLCGFAVACWAPLIPIIEHNLDLSTAQISKLVLTFGIGAVVGMLLSGFLLNWFGLKATYAVCCFTTASSICTIAFMPSYEIVFGTLLLFGSSIGCLDVSINVYASWLEQRYRMMLLSILYGYYSMGEVIGALFMLVLLIREIPPHISILVLVSAIYIVSFCFIKYVPSIKSSNRQENRTFCMPVNPVIFLALIVAFTYIVGGAILDWAGLYVTKEADVPLKYASFGYCIVASCMLLGRMYARPVIKKIGAFNCTLYGAILTATSLLGLVMIPNIYAMIIFFILIGFGMANISPLATSAAGMQKKMPLISAISFVSICGYTGLLLGPAVLGLIATFLSLSGVFIFLGVLTLISATLVLLCKKDIMFVK